MLAAGAGGTVDPADVALDVGGTADADGVAAAAVDVSAATGGGVGVLVDSTGGGFNVLYVFHSVAPSAAIKVSSVIVPAR